MRDRQARGKNPYQSSADNSDMSDLSDNDNPGGVDGRTPSSAKKSAKRTGATGRLTSKELEPESHARIEKKKKAMAMLDSPELLRMWALSQGDVSALGFLSILLPSAD